MDVSGLEKLTDMIAAYGLRGLGGVAILLVGFWLAKMVSRLADSAMARVGKVDVTLRSFVSSLVRYAVLVFTFLAALSQVGIQTASLIAVFGAAGLAIGLALQGTLSHLASGVMLLMFRPFRLGDDAEGGGHRGKVRSMTLFTTELETEDKVLIIIPNGQLWGSAIKNYSRLQSEAVDKVA